MQRRKLADLLTPKDGDFVVVRRRHALAHGPAAQRDLELDVRYGRRFVEAGEVLVVHEESRMVPSVPWFMVSVDVTNPETDETEVKQWWADGYYCSTVYQVRAQAEAEARRMLAGKS